ncbi:MAG: NosD domain-containing protein, partial [Bellilinea sp.]
NDISMVNSGVKPSPTSWVFFGTGMPPTAPIATLLATPQPTATPVPGQPTSTQSGYPYPIDTPYPTPTFGGYP